MVEAREPLRRRGRALRDAVLAAALEELEAHGVDHATIAGVAQRAGVHETSVYRQFGSREELFTLAVLTDSEQRIPVPDTGSLRGDLEETLRLSIAAVDAPLGLALLRSGALAAGAYRAEQRAFWRTRTAAFSVIFERAIERGEVAADVDVGLAFEMLLGPFHSRVLATGFRVDDDLPERVTAMLLAGLGRPSEDT